MYANTHNQNFILFNNFFNMLKQNLSTQKLIIKAVTSSIIYK